MNNLIEYKETEIKNKSYGASFKAMEKISTYDSYEGICKGQKFSSTHSDGKTINEIVNCIIVNKEEIPQVIYNEWNREGRFTHYGVTTWKFIVCESGCSYDLKDIDNG